jgi:CO dehydrogenase/acetyl-CoA synthase delta subunit
MFEPRAFHLDLVDVENALLRAAFGDYADEAAVLLLLNHGHWLSQLRSADLITLAPDIDDEGLWAQIAWTDLEPALSAGRIVGSDDDVQLLRAAASIADGQRIDLGDVAAGLDRHRLKLLLAAIAHAAGSHDHRRLTYDDDGIVRSGELLPPLVAWPVRD